MAVGETSAEMHHSLSLAEVRAEMHRRLSSLRSLPGCIIIRLCWALRLNAAEGVFAEIRASMHPSSSVRILALRCSTSLCRDSCLNASYFVSCWAVFQCIAIRLCCIPELTCIITCMRGASSLNASWFVIAAIHAYMYHKLPALRFGLGCCIIRRCWASC